MTATVQHTSPRPPNREHHTDGRTIARALRALADQLVGVHKLDAEVSLDITIHVTSSGATRSGETTDTERAMTVNTLGVALLLDPAKYDDGFYAASNVADDSNKKTLNAEVRVFGRMDDPAVHAKCRATRCTGNALKPCAESPTGRAVISARQDAQFDGVQPPAVSLTIHGYEPATPDAETVAVHVGSPSELAKVVGGER